MCLYLFCRSTQNHLLGAIFFIKVKAEFHEILHKEATHLRCYIPEIYSSYKKKYFKYIGNWFE